jgi:hypothetical protein
VASVSAQSSSLSSQCRLAWPVICSLTPRVAARAAGRPAKQRADAGEMPDSSVNLGPPSTRCGNRAAQTLANYIYCPRFSAVWLYDDQSRPNSAGPR